MTPAPGTTTPPPHTPAPASAPVPERSSRLPLVAVGVAGIAVAIAVAALVFRPFHEGGRPAAPESPSGEVASTVGSSPSSGRDRPEPPTPPPAPVAPPAAPEPEQRMQPAEIARQAESAKALSRSGRYEEAARIAGRLLQAAPANADAQRLMKDLSRYARQAADDALAEASTARTQAEGVRAPALVPSVFDKAVATERAGRALISRGDYARATATLYTARGLFRSAEVEASRQAQRAAEDAPRVTSAPRPSSPAPPSTESSSEAPSLPAVSEPSTPPRSTTPPPPPPAPAPAAQAPPSVPAMAASADEAIRELLQRYTAAFESRNISALKRVWPTLSAAQERAIRSNFENARSLEVTLESPRIQVSGESATVTAVRRYALLTVDGHDLRTETRSTFSLRATPNGWVIQNVQHETPR
jgi:tetratricopeptide (TPR) repeat protein